ncbi:hypothetical protein NMY22_g7995 [Coprinellus aureogranulatus]|nr:hypothetical protein NMY22_g7995 [Coprinellus aureogranulatus]
MASRTLNASEWVATLVRGSAAWRRTRGRILEKLFEEVAWANTIAAIAETQTQINATLVIKAFTRLVTTKDLDDADSREMYQALFSCNAVCAAAFPVFTRVWWNKKNLSHEAESLQSLDDVIHAFQRDRRFIYWPNAVEFVKPGAPQRDVEEVAKKYRQEGKAALKLVGQKWEEVRMKQLALETVIVRSGRFAAFDRHLQTEGGSVQ